MEDRRKDLIELDQLLQSIGFRIIRLTESETHREDDPEPTVYGITGYFMQCAQKDGRNIQIVPTATRILKSGNRTIVFWTDGTKTIVKRADDAQDSDYSAFLAALGIKIYGSNSALKRIVKRTEVQPQKKRKEQKGE